MSFCIVVLSYNHPELTAKTVRSALPFQKPIILVHNGSELRHQKKLEDEFSTIEHLIIKKNEGYSGGINAGLAHAFLKYDWILFLTNDTELLTLGMPQTQPSQVAPLIYFRKKEKIDSIGGIFYPNKAHLHHCRNENEFQIKKNSYLYAPGTAFFLHKDVFNKVGLIDQSLHTYWEDVDYSVRVQKSGFPILIDSTTTILHRVGKTCHDDTFYTTYLFQRNKKKISLKYATHLGKIRLFFVFLRDLYRVLKVYWKTKNSKRLLLYLKAIRD